MEHTYMRYDRMCLLGMFKGDYKPCRNNPAPPFSQLLGTALSVMFPPANFLQRNPSVSREKTSGFFIIIYPRWGCGFARIVFLQNKCNWFVKAISLLCVSGLKNKRTLKRHQKRRGKKKKWTVMSAALISIAVLFLQLKL